MAKSTTEDASAVEGADTPAPAPVIDMDRVNQVVTDAAKSAVETLTAGLPDQVRDIVREVAGGALDAGAAQLPQLEDQALAALKDWVRKELDLLQAGHSEQTRVELNP